MKIIPDKTLDTCALEDKTCSCCAVDFFEEKPPLWKRQALITAIAGGIILAAGITVKFLTPYDTASLLMFLAVTVLAGRDIFKNAVRSLLALRLDMNCLMGIAAIGAFFIGHGEEGAAVIYLFFVAESLEKYASENAERSIRGLLHLAPEKARVKKQGTEVEMHVHEIEPGNIIAIRPGEKVPLDGKVVSGHSSVNESTLTGESVPVDKIEGDEVFAGTLNEDGYLEVLVEKKSEETRLAKIIALVREAERKKSRTERLIDRFARYYTPAVITLALMIFLVPSYILGQDWNTWFYRALVLLVVSCPCALAISTPVAMVSAITSAARQGVLIKGAPHLEELSRVKACAFDKTGTLTRGHLEVVDIVAFNGHSSRDVLAIAASMEKRSEHPIAKAIVRRAYAENISLQEPARFRSIKGKGLEAVMNGRTYYAGSRNFLHDLSVTLPSEPVSFQDAISGSGHEGKTIIFIAGEREALGAITLEDRVRDNASAIVSHLKEAQIRTEMLTGDNKKVAASLAGRIGIDAYHADLLPEDKVRVIEDLRSRLGHVAMIGEGVNDAPALAVANVGIAMGSIGSDVAIETADIALMHDDLSGIDYLVSLSRKTMQVVRQNVAAAVLIKGSFTVLAAFGLINLWIAVGIGDMGLSLAVILNSMRLTRLRA